MFSHLIKQSQFIQEHAYSLHMVAEGEGFDRITHKTSTKVYTASSSSILFYYLNFKLNKTDIYMYFFVFSLLFSTEKAKSFFLNRNLTSYIYNNYEWRSGPGVDDFV